MSKPKTLTQVIIDERGGTKAVAETLNVGRTTVQMWKSRNKIPRTAWPDLIEAYPELTLETLKASEAV